MRNVSPRKVVGVGELRCGQRIQRGCSVNFNVNPPGNNGPAWASPPLPGRNKRPNSGPLFSNLFLDSIVAPLGGGCQCCGPNRYPGGPLFRGGCFLSWEVSGVLPHRSCCPPKLSGPVFDRSCQVLFLFFPMPLWGFVRQWVGSCQGGGVRSQGVTRPPGSRGFHPKAPACPHP